MGAISTSYTTSPHGVVSATSFTGQAPTVQAPPRPGVLVKMSTPGRPSDKPEQLPLNNTPNLVTMGGTTWTKGFPVTIGNWREVLPGMAFLSADAGGLGPSPDGTPMMQLV